MAEPQNIRRSLLLRTRLAQLFQKRALWSSQFVQAINLFRLTARERRWEAFLFGGVPRGLWVNGTGGSVRDFDIVIADSAFEDVINAFGNALVRKNRFGGAKLLIQGCEFDVWPLSQTWAFSAGLINDVRFEALPRTTFLTIDSIVIELAPRGGSRRRVFDAGFFRSVKDRHLDICLESNPYPELCVVRSLRIAHLFGFTLSPRLGTYVHNVIHKSSSQDLQKAQLQHYRRMIFDQDELLDLSDRIAMQLATDDKGALRIFPNHATQTYLWPEWLAIDERARAPKDHAPVASHAGEAGAPSLDYQQAFSFPLSI